MATENQSGVVQSSQGAADLSSSTTIPSRKFVDAHLDSQQAVVTAKNDTAKGVLSSDPKAKELLVDQALRQQSGDRLKEDQLQEFAKQEKETIIKIAEVKSLISEGRNKVAGVEASYKEFKDSWKFWRGWTSEEDRITQSLAREKELLKAHEKRLTDFESRQEQFNKTKEEYLKALEQPKEVSRGTYVNKDRVLSQLRAQSAGLENLVVLDLAAMQRYKYSEENDEPQNAWKKMKTAAVKSFSESKAGRLVIGVATLVDKVVTGVKDIIVAAGSFVTDGNNWSKVGGAIKKGWVFVTTAENWGKLGDAISTGASKAWDFVTTGENWKKLGTAIANGASKAWDFVTSAENWNKLGSAIATAASKAWDFVTTAENWKTLGSAIVTGLGKAWEFITTAEGWKKLGKALGEVLLAIPELLVDPNSAWDKICKSTDKFMTVLTEGLGIGIFWNAAKGALGFVKSLSDSLGITCIIAGAANLLSMPFRLLQQSYLAVSSTISHLYNYAVGNISLEQMSDSVGAAARAFNSNMAEGLKQSGRLLTGLSRLTLECTGIADISRGVMYAIKGDWTQAGMYFGLGVANFTAVIATILTAGAGAGLYAGICAIKENMKKAVIRLGEKCLSIVSKGLGEVIGKEFFEKTSMDLLKKQAVAVADDLVEMCAEKGLALDTIEEMTRGLTKTRFKNFLEKSGLGEIVEKRVTKALQVIIDTPSPKALAKALSDIPGLASLTGKEIKAARELLLSGKHLDQVAKTITKEITDSLYARMAPELEKAFAARLRSSLLGQVDSPAAKKLAAQCQKEASERGISLITHVDDYVSRASAGFRKGFREALEEIVEAAVKRAIKKLKFPKDSVSYFQMKGEEIERKTAEKKLEAAVLKLEKQQNSLEKKAKRELSKKIEDTPIHMKQTKLERVVIDGKAYSVRMEQLDSGEWRSVSKTLLSEERKASRAVAEAATAENSKITQFPRNNKDKAA